MKIIHFHPDGRMAMKFVAPLMEAEGKAGYRTQLIVSNDRDRAVEIVIPYDLSFFNLLVLPLALWKIMSCLRVHKPDLVISHNSKSSLLPLLGAWLSRTRVRIYFNHGIPYIAYHGILRWLLQALEFCNCILATDVVTVSGGMQTLLNNFYSRNKARIIHNGSACGIDLNIYSPVRYSRTKWRQSLHLSDEDLVLVYVGRPHKRKGFEIVLRIWSEYIHELHINLVLCGPSINDVQKYLSFVPPNVITLGFVNNIPEVLSGSDALLLPSYHEGLSYACLESHALGMLVIANDIPGIGDMINNGVTGFLVKNNDIQKYVEYIRQLDKNRVLFEDIKQRALKNVKRFSREEFIPSYLSFLREVLLR